MNNVFPLKSHVAIQYMYDRFYRIAFITAEASFLKSSYVFKFILIASN